MRHSLARRRAFIQQNIQNAHAISNNNTTNTKIDTKNMNFEQKPPYLRIV